MSGTLIHSLHLADRFVMLSDCSSILIALDQGTPSFSLQNFQITFSRMAVLMRTMHLSTWVMSSC